MNDSVCEECGTNLSQDDSDDMNDPQPCPNCGSIPPKIFFSAQAVANLEVVSHVSTQGVVNFEVIPASKVISLSNLLLQTIIIPGAKTEEGQLIEMVAIPWFGIIDFLKHDPTAVQSIPARMWEEIIAGAYKKAGFDEVTLTPRSGDYGRDVIAIKRGIGFIRVIDQVKAYKPGNLVTADDVRALVGVLQVDGASKGFLTTTSDFAPKLRVDPLISPLIPSRLELVNGDMLIKRLEELAKKK